MADFTFSTLKYERPDFTEVEQLFEKLVKQVQEAASYEGLKELLKKAERVQNKLMTACTIASIRHTLIRRILIMRRKTNISTIPYRP